MQAFPVRLSHAPQECFYPCRQRLTYPHPTNLSSGFFYLRKTQSCHPYSDIFHLRSLACPDPDLPKTGWYCRIPMPDPKSGLPWGFLRCLHPRWSQADLVQNLSQVSGFRICHKNGCLFRNNTGIPFHPHTGTAGDFPESDRLRSAETLRTFPFPWNSPVFPVYSGLRWNDENR